MQEYNFSSVCNKAFKRTIISSRNITFDDKLAIGEDQLFLFEYAMNIASIKSVNDIIYNLIPLIKALFRVNTGSICLISL